MQYDSQAVILVCNPQLLGCATHIEIEGKYYLLDTVNNQLNNQLTKMVTAYQKKGITRSNPGTVTGFIVREGGHFPNPMAEFDVFKAMSLQFE